MSRQLITEYRSELDRIHAASGSKRESVVREAFKDLLKRWGKSRDLIFLAEHEYITPTGDRRYIDGALVHSIRVPFGYWEAKDTNDNLDEEIRKKIAAGYPRDNIIYEDTDTAVLIQNKREVARVSMEDADQLFHLLELFFAYERPEIADFRKAVAQFRSDLPAVLGRLREIIAEKRAQSRDFARAELAFLDHAREAINPAVSEEDVQEMLIQHVLTEDIFAKVFDNPEFHRRNNVAAELYKLEEKLFGYGEKSKLLAALRPYYAGIESTAALIESHSEKQQFLKGLYENFYKVYNPLAADRLGVVYTPGEIVRFMIRSADWLCHKHFGKGLDDRGVEILDPATGTGTFIVELLEHFRGNREKLAWKYKEELHANEVAILPYYVANLNIEATYHAITGQFAEFPGLVFVDTLDNVDALGIYSGHQHDLLGAIADENAERIKRQNRRKISVIIGNPPYNANQQSENDNNKNRRYERVDQRIKQTYIKASTAQKTKLYDMYARFYRWASDRLSDEGILAFITNRSFIESRTFDGFRKLITLDFQDIWVIDLGGDVRMNPKLSGTKHNVFGIQTGVAIALLVRTSQKRATEIRYARRPEDETAEDKLSWLQSTPFEAISFDALRPTDTGDWLNQIEESDWSSFFPIADRKTKQGTSSRNDKAIFKLYSLGVKTNRDDWTISRSRDALEALYRYTIEHYDTFVRSMPAGAKRGWQDITFNQEIKWTRKLRKLAASRTKLAVKPDAIQPSLYRPFSELPMTFVPELNEDQYQLDRIIEIGEQNRTILLNGYPSAKPAQTLATDLIWHHDTLDKTNGLPRYRYAKSGERIDNITDWALSKFVANYGRKAGVTKDAIFAYCYAVLHDPVYREKYALNLKREFPRIPFCDDFAKWAGWGQQLLDLHIGYEKAEPFPFTRVESPSPRRGEGRERGSERQRASEVSDGSQPSSTLTPPSPSRERAFDPKPKLKSDPDKGLIIVDEDTQLADIPREAWDYRLGNRSAIDWVLDQHKEKTPRDPTVREKFNTYRFADHKESMIDLLSRVITVSLETIKITDAMRELGRAEEAV